MSQRGTENDTMTGSHHVKAMLNYLVDTAEKPVNYMYTPPPGVPPRTGQYAKYPMSIYDGRALAEQFSLDTHGFLLTRHETQVKNFYDEHEVRTVYYPEVERPGERNNRRSESSGI